ncbi:nucleotide exchange factor GrpE [Nocardioides aestuarii]|uniref:Protein GrpE n=1 Tax=Nocardioides aestuarii TaxID=252231 RepID=A0ABW4TLH5_9ACTN
MTHPGSFGDDAAEMANESEVEAPVAGDSAPGRHRAGHADHDQPDTSGVDNWMEEGGPLEPSDVTEVETGEEGAAGDARVAELTTDLQRIQAEFLNYKRRVERDRGKVAEDATYRVLVPIIDVLDTVDRAREHGDLDDGFAAVADQLERVVTGLGLTKFGTPGEPFDPNLHEALSHIGEDPEVEVTTCKVVAKAGYRIGERVVRAAQVLVVDPA